MLVETYTNPIGIYQSISTDSDDAMAVVEMHLACFSHSVFMFFTCRSVVSRTGLVIYILQA